MAIDYTNMVIIIFLTLLVFIIFTDFVLGDLKKWNCKNALADEINRIEGIACTMDEYQISYDILDISDARCVESIYYDDFISQLCYKFVGENEPECRERKCGEFGRVDLMPIEYVGFKKDPIVVSRPESMRYDVIIEPQKISLFICTGGEKACFEFQDPNECTKHIWCKWIGYAGAGCSGIRPTCKDLYIKYEEYLKSYSKRGLDFESEKELCEYEGCLWIGE